MTVIAIDPGPKESALIVWDGQRIHKYTIAPNTEVLARLGVHLDSDMLAVEMIASYGMAVGREVFETCVWIGRFVERFQPGKFQLVYRKDVKIHHCQSMRATDSNIRQALLDKYGEQGTKKAPGPTYGLKKHLWSAFAIATYVSESLREVERQIPLAVQ